MGVQPGLSGGAEPPPVTIRGVAVEHDCNILRRRGLNRGLLAAQARHAATAVLDRMLIDLAEPNFHSVDRLWAKQNRHGHIP